LKELKSEEFIALFLFSSKFAKIVLEVMKKFTKKRIPSLEKAGAKGKKKVPDVQRMWHLAKRLAFSKSR
jgi:hypothetical protein